MPKKKKKEEKGENCNVKKFLQGLECFVSKWSPKQCKNLQLQLLTESENKNISAIFLISDEEQTGQPVVLYLTIENTC
jgi:hypothetical protein